MERRSLVLFTLECGLSLHDRDCSSKIFLRQKGKWKRKTRRNQKKKVQNCKRVFTTREVTEVKEWKRHRDTGQVSKTYQSSNRPGAEGSPPPSRRGFSHTPCLCITGCCGRQTGLLRGQQTCLRTLASRALGGCMPTGQLPDNGTGPSPHGSPPSLPAQLPLGRLHSPSKACVVKTTAHTLRRNTRSLFM